jgi:hypothetical protein
MSDSTISPSYRSHDRAKSGYRANQRQHGKTDKQKKPCPDIVKENVVHDASFSLSQSLYQPCQPQEQTHGARGSCFFSHRPQQGQCLVQAVRWVCLVLLRLCL